MGRHEINEVRAKRKDLVMNNTALVNNVSAAKLSIAPNPEAKYCDRQLALLIFIAIWIFIFLIDALLRCNDVLNRRARRRQHLASSTIHNPPYELQAPNWRAEQFMAPDHDKRTRD